MSLLLDAIQNELEESPLTTKRRNELADSDFAIPRTRKYPIHDINHARNALARVAQMGTAEEKEKVRAAVAKRYPDINKKDESVTEKKDEKEYVFAIKASGENADKFEDFMRKVAGFCNMGCSRQLAVVDSDSGNVMIEKGDGDEGKLQWFFDGDGSTRISIGKPKGLQVDEAVEGEERREVAIGQRLLMLRRSLTTKEGILDEIERLGKELIAIHEA